MNGMGMSILAGLALASCTMTAPVHQAKQDDPKATTYAGLTVENASPKRADKVVKSDAEWKKQLTPEQYRILRAKDTEKPFCGGLLHVDKPGTFVCAGCGLPLFTTAAKFESGTGWPSFFQPIKRENVWLRVDRSYGMTRYEVLCARCDGHLGHVFDDGPVDKTGIRYCINSESMKFVPDKS